LCNKAQHPWIITLQLSNDMGLVSLGHTRQKDTTVMGDASIYKLFFNKFYVLLAVRAGNRAIITGF
jgi:hypothetical protein